MTKPTTLTRRNILRLGSLATAGSLGWRFQSAMAGPFTGADFDKLVPADKKLSAAWLRSLIERGEPEWSSGGNLNHIGMPVGGLCCGQVYLSGDGRLWHWDVFNHDVAPPGMRRNFAPHYGKPMPVASPVDIGFQIRANGETRTLDLSGFPQVRFRGAYPMGFVDFRDDAFPVNVSLEAFSPFTPLDVDASSLPLTVMSYTLRNTSAYPVEVALLGSMSNPVLVYSGPQSGADFVNRIVKRKSATCLHCTVERQSQPDGAARPDIVFEDFEGETYEGWTVEGTAFGAGPVAVAETPAYQGNVGAHGKRLVNSHHTREGADIVAADTHTGTLSSKPFKIERRLIHALVGGGNAAAGVGLELLVDDKVVATLAGANSNAMTRASFDTTPYEGKTARLRIVDQGTGLWGNIGVDHIVFSDLPAQPGAPFESLKDMGDMTLAILDNGPGVFASAGSADLIGDAKTTQSSPTERPKGAVGKTLTLKPGEQATVSFTVAWRFPNHVAPVDKGHYYATRFPTSLAVIGHHAADHEKSHALTRLWHETWYDSTLPHWLLDRSFLNVSILATTTCLRMESGRFWAWEGVGCCHGTCSHVWHYAQSVGRVFPELERITRENVDYGLAYQPDGMIFYRAEFGKREASDGQCGTILRVYREHTMSPDDAFLRRIWPRVKGSTEYLIRHLDVDGNGVFEGAQYNTLDGEWFGPISWISSLYLGALRAGSVMAREMGDESFAKQCDELVDRGGKWLSDNLFDGEFFYQNRDANHPAAIGAGIGCHIDQMMGQGWAHQLALGRILPEDKTRTALQSLWRYNFSPDVGVYRKEYPSGRWLAMPGEAGLLMTTFPKGGREAARGIKSDEILTGYFNECMNGFEYQAAGHMIAEGLVQEGLAVTRAIHDRYAPSLRNPYNETECGDHYARSMASHGVFVTICGFECHGPKKHLGFAPKLTPENFKAPFIAAEGWGGFTQRIDNGKLTAEIEVRHGRLSLATLALEHEGAEKLSVKLGAATLPAMIKRTGKRILITLAAPVDIAARQKLMVTLS